MESKDDGGKNRLRLQAGSAAGTWHSSNAHGTSPVSVEKSCVARSHDKELAPGAACPFTYFAHNIVFS